MGNKILAIKGHPTRGKEVIEILEMLGGKNSTETFRGNHPQGIYYIQTCDSLIWVKHVEYCELNDFEIFNLEDFLEKYPYKIGDKVLLNNQVKVIKGIGWDSKNNEVIYTLETNINGVKTKYQVFSYDLQPYKEEIKAEDHLEIYTDPAIDDDSKTDIIIDGEKLIAPKGYAIVNATTNSNKLIVEYVKNKPQYPKTFKECCDLLETDRTSILRPGYKYKQFIEFQELLICRDSYWKIAGEEMGLSEPWKPSANDEGKTHSLYYNRYTDSLDKCEGLFESNAILDFPTEEMRDAFFENFKDLIESCKEFL